MNKSPFPTAGPPATIIHTLQAWSERDPDRVALTRL